MLVTHRANPNEPMNLLAFCDDGPVKAPISPFLEMGAYEALWLEKGTTFKSIAKRFAANLEALPSDFIDHSTAEQCAAEVVKKLKKENVRRFGIRVHHAYDYPQKLRAAKHPVELLYYRGTWELSERRSVAIIGNRNASPEGEARARRLAKVLVEREITVVSGLAAGIDSAAHRAALEVGGQTIAVVGTPLGQVYPTQNRKLQEHIAAEHLLISQVPVLRYSKQGYQHNRFFFPERNITMSALTEATVIVEAGETSGTLTQAMAALHQGRKLFILNSCFQQTNLIWPSYYEKRGAIRVREPEDILEALG